MTTVFIPLGLAFLMVTVGLGLAAADFRAVASRPGVVAVGLAGQTPILALTRRFRWR